MPKAQFTGNIDGDRIVDGSIKGEDLAPDLALSTTGTINANKMTVSTTADVSGGTLTTSTAQKTAIVNNGKGVLTKSDVGLNNVDNTSDLNKPISTASSVAINEKNTAVINETAGTSLYLGDMVCRMSDGKVGVLGRDFEHATLSSHTVLYNGKVFVLDSQRVSRRKSIVLYRKDTDNKLYLRVLITNLDREGSEVGKSTVTMGSEVLVDANTSKHGRIAFDPNNLYRGVLIYNDGGNNNYMTAKTFVVDSSDTGTTITLDSSSTALNSATSDTFHVAFTSKSSGSLNSVDYKGHFIVGYRKDGTPNYGTGTGSYELQLVSVNGSGSSHGINTASVATTQIMANTGKEWEGVRVVAFPNNSKYFGLLWNHRSSTTFTADDGGNSNNPASDDLMFCCVRMENSGQTDFGLYTFNQVNGRVTNASFVSGNTGDGAAHQSYNLAANPIWDGDASGSGGGWSSSSNIVQSAKFLIVFTAWNSVTNKYEIWATGINVNVASTVNSDGFAIIQHGKFTRIHDDISQNNAQIIIDFSPYISNRFIVSTGKSSSSYFLMGTLSNSRWYSTVTWHFDGQSTAGPPSGGTSYPDYTWYNGVPIDEEDTSGYPSNDRQANWYHWVGDDVFMNVQHWYNNTSSIGKIDARLGNIGQVNLTNLNQFVGFVYDDPTSKTIYEHGETVPIQIAGHVKNLSASVTMNYFGTTSTMAKVRQMNMLDVSVTNEPLGDWYLGYTIGTDGIFLYYVNDHSTAYLT